jgi:hypothetical protein
MEETYSEKSVDSFDGDEAGTQASVVNPISQIISQITEIMEQKRKLITKMEDD